MVCVGGQDEVRDGARWLVCGWDGGRDRRSNEGTYIDATESRGGLLIQHLVQPVAPDVKSEPRFAKHFNSRYLNSTQIAQRSISRERRVRDSAELFPRHVVHFRRKLPPADSIHHPCQNHTLHSHCECL
eukprot:3916582-Rhodomonas_salina.2